MDASSATAPPLRRFSLITGPWHTSSRVVAVLALVFLVFCNVPGQHIDRLTPAPLPYWKFDYQPHYEHGWPLTFIDRDQTLPNLPSLDSSSQCWSFWEGNPRVSWAALAVNIVVVLVAAVVGGAFFELWRRRRRRLWQFHLVDALGALTLVSCICAWFVAERREAAWEQALIHGGPLRPWGTDQPTSAQSVIVMKYREGGITWLRRYLGDRNFDYLDRAVSIGANSSALRRAARLSEVQVVQLEGPVTQEDLAVLEQFPSLEFVNFWHARVHDRDGNATLLIQLPRLPSLRGLIFQNFWERPATLRGFDKLRSVEYLYLHNCRLDSAGMRELGSMTRLRALSLTAVDVPADGCSHLGRLSQLEQLQVSGGICTEESLRAIGQLKKLRELHISGCTPPRGSLRHLQYLKNLQVLNLTNVAIALNDDESLRAVGELSELRELTIRGCSPPLGSGRYLGRLRHLETLDLTGATIAFEDLAELKHLRQLKVLDLRGVPLCQTQYEALGAWLPDCEIR